MVSNFEANRSSVFMLDPRGNVATWNAGAQAFKGYLPSEIIGCHFSRFYGEEDRAAGKPERELIDALRDGRCEDTGKCICTNCMQDIH